MCNQQGSDQQAHMGSLVRAFACTDPESFVRRGPTLTFVLEGRDDPSKYHYKRAIIRPIFMAFRWRADNGPNLYAGLVALLPFSWDSDQYC